MRSQVPSEEIKLDGGSLWHLNHEVWMVVQGTPFGYLLRTEPARCVTLQSMNLHPTWYCTSSVRRYRRGAL